MLFAFNYSFSQVSVGAPIDGDLPYRNYTIGNQTYFLFEEKSDQLKIASFNDEKLSINRKEDWNSIKYLSTNRYSGGLATTYIEDQIINVDLKKIDGNLDIIRKTINLKSKTEESSTIFSAPIKDVALRNVTYYFQSITSPDSSYFALYFYNPPKFKENNLNKDVLNFLILDSELNLIRTEVYELPYVESEISFIDFAIDNQGNVYELFIHKTDQGSGIEFFQFSNGEINIAQTNFVYNNMIPKVLRMATNSEGNILINGLYADSENVKDSYDGIFRIELQPNGEIIHLNAYEISPELLALYDDKGVAKKNAKLIEKGKNPSVEYLSIHDIKQHNNKSMTFIAEKSYSKSSDVATYSYDCELYICHSDQNGELVWMNKIPKNQSSPLTKTVYFDNQLFVFYLDDPANQNLSNDTPPKRYLYSSYKGDLICQKIDLATGEMSKTKLFNLTDVKGKELKKLDPTDLIFNEGGYVYMYGELKSNEFQIVEINLNQL